MRVFAIKYKPTPPRPTFEGYNCEVKTLYKKGLLPQLKKDFYGHEIKKATTEHLIPKSKGGKNSSKNTVIADATINNLRGDKPLADFINFKAMAEYFEVFRNKVFGNLNGNEYIAGILETVSECLRKGL